MNGEDVIVTLVNGGLASIVLEYIGKPLLRLVIKGLNSLFGWSLTDDFSTGFYVVVLATLNVALVPFMAWMGWVEPITDSKVFIQRLILAAVGALVSLGAYHSTIGRSKENIAWNKSMKQSDEWAEQYRKDAEELASTAKG